MEDAFSKTSEEILKHFGVSENLGLSQEEVKKNRLKYGPNGKNHCNSYYCESCLFQKSVF